MPAHLRVAETLLQDLLCPTDPAQRIRAVVRVGTTPFFTGAAVIAHSSLCDFFRDRLEEANTDGGVEGKEDGVLEVYVHGSFEVRQH